MPRAARSTQQFGPLVEVAGVIDELCDTHGTGMAHLRSRRGYH